MEPKGGGHHSLAGEGAGVANSDDWRESLAPGLLCVYRYYLVGEKTSLFLVGIQISIMEIKLSRVFSQETTIFAR